MVEIRHAGPDDTGELLTVQRAAWVTEAQLHEAPSMPPLTETREDIDRAIETQTVLVARDGHRLVGAVRAHARDGVWHVGRLGVAPDRQGEGIGSLLLRAVEHLAPAGIDRFELFTGPKSAHNVRLYERHGYRVLPSDDGLIHLTKPRETPMSQLRKIDHVGIAVPDLDEAIAFYRDTFGVVSVHEEVNEQQGVREAMLAVGDGETRIQLLAPLSENSTIAKFLGRNGPGIQQLAYTVDDIDAASAELRAKGLRLLYDEPRPGTAGSRVNFVHPKDAGGVLVELVEPAKVTGR